MILHIDLRWLLERQTDVLPEGPDVHDYSGLVAAVARHRVNTPRLGEDADPAWRAASLLHTLIRLRPLPARNALFACGVAVAYMAASNQGVDPPYGALVDLARAVDTGKADVYTVAEHLRSWRI
ncbi:toxin Doc [Embleya sp. MST-111070]|uniref:toxin Doc n=1 Tax=Embleya sp. MST-111070 TaxID=3398231 RepID=UPI003F73B591